MIEPYLIVEHDQAHAEALDLLRRHPGSFVLLLFGHDDEHDVRLIGFTGTPGDAALVHEMIDVSTSRPL